MSLGPPPKKLQRKRERWLEDTLSHPLRYLRWRRDQRMSIMRRRSEFDQLLQYAPENATIAEIGVWRGDTAKLWAKKAAHLDLIDPWSTADNLSWWSVGATTAKSMDWLYFAVAHEFRERIADGTVRILRMTSDEALQYAIDYDLVFIDGDHKYETVARDLAQWWQQVRPGGVLCGDDYLHGSWFNDDVIRAVNDFAAKIQQPPTLIGQHWVFKKPMERAL